MSIELLSEINDNYQMAIVVHRELADLFWFIYMPGYAMQNEYQYLSEACTQRKIKRYITSTYHTFLPDKLPKSANILDPLVGGKNRKQLKKPDSWKTIQEAFKIYREWEESALKLYEQVAADLFSKGKISAFNFVGEIIREVKAELVFVTDKTIELEAHGYDMPQITADQAPYFERYEYLIKTMFGKTEKFHYWNSARDPASRVLFEKTPEN